MKGFLVFLTAIIAVTTGEYNYEPGLRVRFDVGLFPSSGESFFFDIPRSVSAAREKGWTRTRRPPGPLSQLVMYCPIDKVLCGLYDDSAYIAGLQVAISKSEFSKNILNWKTQGYTSWSTDVDGQCKLFWTLQQYFVDEDFLAISREDRLASRDSSRTLQAGAVWLTGFNRTLEKVPTQQTDIVSEQVFTEQACINWMGQHYYYNMSSTTECTSDQIFPWFPMTMEGELIATGFMTFGQLETASDKRDWLERPGMLAVRAIVPNGPDCLYDLASDPGALTMHIYYIDAPWTIYC